MTEVTGAMGRTHRRKGARLTYDEARRLFHYDPDTGNLSWAVGVSNRKIGDRAGKDAPQWGYRHIRVANREYMEHRVIWLWMTGDWPPSEIDHRNCDGRDNRWANLRLASPSQNQANTRRRRDNTSGAKGVIRMRSKWAARITYNGRNIYIGTYASVAEAQQAYATKATALRGSFARIE